MASIFQASPLIPQFECSILLLGMRVLLSSIYYWVLFMGYVIVQVVPKLNACVDDQRSDCLKKLYFWSTTTLIELYLNRSLSLLWVETPNTIFVDVQLCWNHIITFVNHSIAVERLLSGVQFLIGTTALF